MIHGPGEMDTEYRTWLQLMLYPLHFLVPRFGVGQVPSSRLRPVTQRVGVGMKLGVGHEGPEGVDRSLGGCAPLQ